MGTDFEIQLWVNRVGTTRKLKMHAKTCSTAVYLKFTF